VVKVLSSAGFKIELPFISTRFTLKVVSGGGEGVCAEALGLQLQRFAYKQGTIRCY
jgi:hypothetical protein